SRLDIRTSLALDFPELGTGTALDDLLDDIHRLIDGAFTNLYEAMGVGNTLGGTVGKALQSRDGQGIQNLKAFARREIEILKREIALDLHKTPIGPVSVSTAGGPALVNLGEIRGNIQQVVGTLNEASQAEIAGHLERLAAAIEASAELGDDRGAYMEQVQ